MQRAIYHPFVADVKKSGIKVPLTFIPSWFTVCAIGIVHNSGT